MDSAGGGSKKTLQEMSKEELVQKCKALLALAHKAKAAKEAKKAKRFPKHYPILYIEFLHKIQILDRL